MLSRSYLLLELVWDDGKVDEKLESSPIYYAIRDSVQLQFGDYGVGSVMGALQGWMLASVYLFV